MSSWNFKDLTGQTFGRLTVIERAENTKDGRARWLCRCECGNFCTVTAKLLLNGSVKSCGCLIHDVLLKRNKSHGMRHTKIYGVWCTMISRCENPHVSCFDDYGGRGIKVCERWHEFQNFFDDVSVLPHFGEKGYTLDRIDVNGDYCPENVRWITMKEQANNRRNNVIVEYNGEKISLPQAAEKSGIKANTLWTRIKKGDSGEKLFRPLDKQKGVIKNVRKN